MYVGAGVVDGVADEARDVGLLPGGDDVRGGVGSRVVGQRTLDVGDEVGELLRGAVAVVEGLVGDGEELDQVPARPGLEGAELLLDVGRGVVAPGLANVDAHNHLEAVRAHGRTDVGQRVAVGAVKAQRGEAGRGDGGDVGGDGVRGLALAADRVVWRVRQRPRGLAVAAQGAAGAAAGGAGAAGGARRGHGCGRGKDGDWGGSDDENGRGGLCRAAGGGRGRGTAGAGDTGDAAGNNAAAAGSGRHGGEGAVDDSGGHNLGGDGRGRVSAGQNGCNRGNGHRLVGGHSGGRRSNGVSASGGADLRGAMLESHASFLFMSRDMKVLPSRNSDEGLRR